MCALLVVRAASLQPCRRLVVELCINEVLTAWSSTITIVPVQWAWQMVHGEPRNAAEAMTSSSWLLTADEAECSTVLENRVESGRCLTRDPIAC